MPGCSDGGIASPGGIGSTISPGHDGVDRLCDGRKLVGRQLLLELRLEQIALLARAHGEQHQLVDGDATRGQNPDQPAFAVADHDDFGEFGAGAQMNNQRGGIVDIILEAEILRLAEFLLPAAGAALVVAQRGNAARHQRVRQLLQGGRLDLGPLPS